MIPDARPQAENPMAVPAAPDAVDAALARALHAAAEQLARWFDALERSDEPLDVRGFNAAVTALGRLIVLRRTSSPPEEDDATTQRPGEAAWVRALLDAADRLDRGGADAAGAGAGET